MFTDIVLLKYINIYLAYVLNVWEIYLETIAFIWRGTCIYIQSLNMYF